MFLAPAFLLGLLAVGVPLWLHRVTRANPRREPFASLMFLEASETQRTAKRALRFWPLLLARIALIAALAFAFAGPIATERIVPQQNSNARLHAIVIDSSYSMRYGDRWARALSAAQDVLRSIRGGDRVMLVRAAGRRIELVHEAVPASAAGSVRAALQNLQPSLERLDYGLVMSTAEQWLGSPRLPTVLHFISDLQQSAAPLRFADLGPPPDTAVAMHSVADEAPVNAYIAEAAFAGDDERVLQASIRYLARRAQERTVVLRIDGKELARQIVRLPATAPISPTPWADSEGGGVRMDSLVQPHSQNSAASRSSAVVARFANVELTPGLHRIQLTLEPRDALPHDDAYFAVIEHADPKALLVSAIRDADDSAYFEAALGSLASPRLKVERRTPQDVPGAAGLSAYSLAVIADASALSSAAAQRVLDYAAAGGGVLATLGEQRAGGELPLLEGWRIAEMRNKPTKIGEIATSHPALRDASDWSRERFFKQRAVRPGADDKVLIAYDSGAPLLIERKIGAGRMLVLTSPIERDWSDLAIHPAFVHFIADAGRYLTGADASPVSYTAGTLVRTGLTAAAGGQIFDPRGARVLTLAEARDAAQLVPHLTGFYEVRGVAAARWLAVNVDGRESDLTPLPANFVQRWQALRANRPAPIANAAPAPARARSVGPLLLWIAAALLLLELLLANHYLAIRRG
ncbi:MAG TPA: BatA and WFA domain-containing protein [Steroidobacter sp.]|nr:BatA and WFA domain-containing protein [Steroidobacter sp.]